MIPTFNCAALLKQTLESVLAEKLSLDQMEIVVVDDCSTKDDPEKVAEEFGAGRVRFVRQEQNVGAIRNFNTCVKLARGELVHILHGDDFILPGFYNAVLSHAARFPNIGLICTRSFIVDEANEIEDMSLRLRHMEAPTRNVWPLIYAGNQMQTPSVVVRKSVYDVLGDFDESLVHVADWDMWIRAIANCDGVCINKPLAAYREFAGQDTARLRLTGENMRDCVRLCDRWIRLLPGFDAMRFLRMVESAAVKQLGEIATKRLPDATAANERVVSEVQSRMQLLTLPGQPSAQTVRSNADPNNFEVSMLPKRVFVLCPDYDAPSGGIRRLYRHVDILRQHGVYSAILHDKPGFRCTWFANDTPVLAIGQAGLTSADILVVPEVCGPGLTGIAPGVSKVVFNQNSYLTFRGYPVGGLEKPSPYSNPEVIALFTVSEDNTDYIRYAFPNQRFFRLHYGIDPVFAPKWPKRRAIAYMPRKNAEEVVQVFNLLRLRGMLDGWQLIAIDAMSEAQVAEQLATCTFFFSFGYPEGCPLPPLEAMASGCVVVGYHGWGGREYLRKEFSWPVEAGDVLGFARSAESALQEATTEPERVEHRGRLAAEYVQVNYSVAREEDDIVAAWKAIHKVP